MITAPSATPTQLRLVLAAGATALLCTGLGACSGTSAKPVAAAVAVQNSATSAGPSASATSATSPPAAGTANAPGHPCALLSQGEAVSSVGEPLDPGVESVQGTAGTCLYKSGNDGAFVTFTVTNWEALKPVAQRRGATPVGRIGDEALSFTDVAGSQLLVRKGSTGLRILMHGPGIDALPDRGLAKEEALGRLLVPRL